MNANNYVNMSGSMLRDALADKLEDLLASVAWLQRTAVQAFPTRSDRGFDFFVRLDGRKELWIQCKAQPRPSEFPYIYTAPGEDETGRENDWEPVKVLAAPFISPRMAELCREHDWSWFDLAGNCFLDVHGVVRIERTGKPPVHEPPKPKANLSTPEAARVIRPLLLPEHSGRRWTQRDLAQHTSPTASIGLVNKVIAHLREEAFISAAKQGGFTVTEPLRLLFAWRDAYRFDRHRRLGYFTLLNAPRLRPALANLDSHTGGFAAYAGFSAADFQAPHVRQPKTWLYVRQQDLSRFEEIVEAKQVDSGENIVLLIPSDDGVFYMGDAGGIDDRRMACTNVIQTYVDLWHCGGRGQEAAEALLEQRIKPEWRIRGVDV